MYLRTILLILLFSGLAYFIKGPLRKWIGLLLMVIGGMTISGIGLSFILPEQTLPPSEMITLFISLGLVPAGMGIYMVRKQQKQAQDEKQKAHARKIIHLARKNAGKVTVLDTAEYLDIDTEEARKLLQYMQLKGLLDLTYTPEGVMVYQLMTLNK